MRTSIRDTRVDPRSAVRALGLREGDVIVEVNRKATKDVTAFQNAARADDRSVVLLVYRDGATVYLSLTR